MSLIKIAYDNSNKIDAIKLVRGNKDAIIKTQITPLEKVIKNGTC